MKQYILTILILLLAGTAFAEGNGGFAGSFLRIGLGARGTAMGNAQTADPQNGYGFYYNPASLPHLKNRSANFSHSMMSLDRRFNFVGFSSPLKPHAGFSFGWIYSGVGDITGYNSIGEETGAINHGLHAIYFSFGADIKPGVLSIGVSGKYIREDISDEEDSYDYDGSGMGADLGIILKVLPSLYVGYQLKDINASLTSNTDKIYERGMEIDNKFPLTNRLGIAYTLPMQWIRVLSDVEWSNKGEEKYHFGSEMFIPGAALRFGYDHDHFTFGGGVEFKTVYGIRAILDYAFVNSVVEEGVSHIFSWQLAF